MMLLNSTTDRIMTVYSIGIIKKRKIAIFSLSKSLSIARK